MVCIFLSFWVPSLFLYLCLLLAKQVYLSFYTMMIASLQGNHGYFSYVVINKNKTQDKMKLENI